MTAKSIFIPSPVGGLNLRDPVTTIPITDAKILTGFYPLSKGIKGMGKITEVETLTGDVYSLIPGIDGASLIISTSSKLYFKTSAGGAATDITGGLTMGAFVHSHHYFGGYTYLCSANNQVIRVNAAGTSSAAGWLINGANPDSPLTNGTGYKGRQYYAEVGSTRYHYSTLGAVGGTLTAVDLSTIFAFPGQIRWVSSWNINQGISVEEVFVIATTSGEILIYSGDNPAASNWQIIGHIKLPGTTYRAFYRLGSELFIQTVQGVLPLSQAFQFRGESVTFYSSSDKLGQSVFNANTDSEIAEHTTFPFLYFSVSGSGAIYVLNYQTGAWAKLPMKFGGVDFTVRDFAYMFDTLWVSTGPSGSTTKLFKLDDTAGSQSADAPMWQTPDLDFDSLNNKELKLVRVLLKYAGGANPPQLSLQSSNDFKTLSGTDTKLSALSSGSTGQLEFVPTGSGRYNSLALTVTGDNSQLEIYGMHVFFEDGGPYG